jgi:hypothetical protein
MRRALPTMLLLAAACVPRVNVPEGERQRVAEELAGTSRFLRVAVYVGPFFGDRTMALVSDRPYSELDLLENPDGKTILPPPAERILPPGTRVGIQQVQFPTGVIIFSRPVMTPRYHPWVFLGVEGDERPYVLVLPQTAASLEDVRGDVDRVLVADDPGPAFRALPQAQREAILKKEPVEGMGRQALDMAWGYPDKIVVDRPAGTEEWTWTGGKRRAFLQDERLVRWEPR